MNKWSQELERSDSELSRNLHLTTLSGSAILIDNHRGCLAYEIIVISKQLKHYLHFSLLTTDSF